MNTQQTSIPALPLWGSALLFAIPTLLMWLATRHLIPVAQEFISGPGILCWFVAGGTVFFCLFAAAFVVFWLENRSTSLADFAQRFRFRRLRRSDWLWSLTVLAVASLLSCAIAAAWELVSQILPFVGRPSVSPPFMEVEPLTRDTLWVLAAWLPLFFFNIAGEELWWRGYMLPRQERQHGQRAWLVHGLGLTLFHLPFGVPLTIIVLPFLFGLPLAVQKSRNLWTGFIVHGILNGGGFLAVAFGYV